MWGCSSKGAGDSVMQVQSFGSGFGRFRGQGRGIRDQN